MEIRHVLSFGGGVNSVALMVLLLRENMPLVLQRRIAKYGA